MLFIEGMLSSRPARELLLLLLRGLCALLLIGHTLHAQLFLLISLVQLLVLDTSHGLRNALLGHCRRCRTAAASARYPTTLPFTD